MRVPSILIVALATACSPSTEDVLRAGAADQDELDGDSAGDPDVDVPADAETPNPSLCSFAGLALCDGFEQAQVQSPPWFFVNRAASVTLDTARFYRGGSALHVRTDAAPELPSALRQGELTETAAVPQDQFYARIFAYVQGPLPDYNFRMLGLLQVESPNLGPMLFIEQGKLTLTANDITTQSATDLPLDRWVCLEWYVASSTTGEMRFWVDGVEVTDLRATQDTTRDPPVGRFSIGAAFFGDSTTRSPFDIWYDEVGLDDTRIGCAR